MAKSALQQFGC